MINTFINEMKEKLGDYSTVSEIANYLNVSKKTIYRKLKKNELDFMKLSNYYIIKIDSLKKILTED